jgi:hypothetical protein
MLVPGIILLPKEFRCLVKKTHELDFNDSKKDQGAECYVMHCIVSLRKSKPLAIPGISLLLPNLFLLTPSAAMKSYVEKKLPSQLLRRTYGLTEKNTDGSAFTYKWKTERNDDGRY